MSDFFPPPPPPQRPGQMPPQPPWLGPPANELGVPVAVRPLVAKTEDVAVALAGVAAFSTGLAFRLEVRLRTDDGDDFSDPFGMHVRHHTSAVSIDDVLRFGFEFSDGRRVTNLGGFPAAEAQQAPVLMERGGGGGGRSWGFDYWLWPLPPPGVLTVAVEWAARGIELTRVALEAGPLLEAAAQAEKLWPGDDPDDGAGSFTSFGAFE